MSLNGHFVPAGCSLKIAEMTQMRRIARLMPPPSFVHVAALIAAVLSKGHDVVIGIQAPPTRIFSTPYYRTKVRICKAEFVRVFKLPEL